MTSQDTQLKKLDLPRVFDDGNGTVNVGLVTEICKIVQHPGKKIRILLEACGHKQRPNDDIYRTLSYKIISSDFRDRWHAECEQNKINFFTHYFLIGQYVQIRHKNVGVYSKALIPFFKNRVIKGKKLKFPVLENINLLVDELVKVAEISVKDAALAAWSLIEHCRYSSKDLPAEKSLRDFSTVLTDALITRELSELLSLLKPAAWEAEISEILVAKSKDIAPYSQISKNSVPASNKHQEATVDKRSETEPLDANELSEFVYDKDTIKNAIDEHQHALLQVISDINDLRDTISPETLLKDVEQHTKTILRTTSRINEITKAAEEEFAKKVRLASSRFNLTVLPDTYSLNNISEYLNWANHYKTLAIKCIPLFDLEKKFARVPAAAQREIEKNQAPCQVSYDGIDSFADQKKRQIDVVAAGREARDRIDAIIGTNYLRLDWNPLLSKELREEDWKHLGSYLIYQETFGTQLGIIIRANFDELAEKFNSKIESVLSDTGNSTVELFETILHLTLGQIETLAALARTKSQQRFLATAQLHACLSVTANSKIHGWEYWSAFPLADYTRRNGDELYSRFFSTIFDRVANDNEAPITLTTLQRIINEVIARPTNVARFETDGITDQLNTIVRYYKRGGNTYAELWFQAHSTILVPIQKLIEEKDYLRVLATIEELANNFNIEDHIATWKNFIAEHLRKRSEYDKHIRAQVRNKIDELVEWAETFRAALNTSPKSVDRLEELGLIVKSVLQNEQDQPEALTHWFNYLHNPGKKQFFAWSTSRNTHSAAEKTLIARPRYTAFYPRISTRSPSTYADMLADQLIESMGYHSAENLATNYASLGQYEQYFALSSLVGEGLPPDLDRRVEEAVEELAITQTLRIEALENRLIEIAPSEGLNSYTQDLYRLLNEQLWGKLDAELSEVERFASDLELQKIAKDARSSIVREISKLGGRANGNDSMEQLGNILAELVKSLIPRKKHLSALRALSAFENSHLDIVEAANLAIQELEDIDKLPTEEHSSYIAYVLEQATVPVSEELHRHRTLIPSYVAKLKAMALMLISNSLKPDFLCGGDSEFLNALEETADLWKSLARKGREIADLIERRFKARGINIDESKVQETMHWTTEQQTRHPAQDFTRIEVSAFDEKMSAQSELKFRQYSERLSDRDMTSWNISELRSLTKNGDWKNLACAAMSVYTTQTDKQSPRSIDLRATWMLSLYFLDDEIFSEEDYAILFHMLNTHPNLTALQLINSTKNSKGASGELVNKFLNKIWMTSATDSEGSTERLATHELLNILADRTPFVGRIRSLIQFAFAIGQDHESTFLRNLWDFYTGDSKQAETRSAIMHLFWKCAAHSALACCITYISPTIVRRKADALAAIAGQALTNGRFELLESFSDLKKQIASKPFSLFVDLLRVGVPRQLEAAATFSLIGKVEKTQNPNEFQALLNIDPRRSNCPDTLTLTLPRESPVKFKGDQVILTLEGPFLETAVRPVLFSLININAKIFQLQLTCSAISITGSASKFPVNLEINLSGSDVFKRLESDDIEEAYNNFPEYQMRGADYVSRITDERKIERSLFSSRTVRSLWIASPRRSGKTTMLYRILDAYSHKVGRDAIVVYLTMDRSFSEPQEFNDWIWNRLRTIPANRELREMFEKFDDLGRELPWTADAGTFLGELANRLMAGKNATRVIYLVDEIDKFASMHFAGGAYKESANSIMWQLRQLIGERRDIGIVFAGSSAARRLFVTNADAPFFNGITLIELTPFSCKEPADEIAARAIVEPRKVAARYALPKETIEHLIWVCAGIPYYMKLVAGATVGTVRQSHIMASDINEGLRALLKKSTGVVQLDEMSGDPGSDELRTMALENGDDRLLTLAVLYTVAESYSALGGHPIYRQTLLASDSPLVARFGLKTKQIDRGLKLCMDLGLLTNNVAADLALTFMIPILGESIRYAAGKLWAHIDHEITAIAEMGRINA